MTIPPNNIPIKTNLWGINNNRGVLGVGNRTVGNVFAVLQTGTINKVRFCTRKTGSHTIRVSIWNPSGNKISQDFVCSGANDYEFSLSSPYVITLEDIARQDQYGTWFYIGMYEISGTNYTYGRGAMQQGPWSFGYCYTTIHNSFYSAGDAKPTTALGGAEAYYVPIDPIITPDVTPAFSLSDPPEVTNRSPAPDDVGVDKDAPVYFSVIDDIQVDLTTVLVYVRGELVFDGSVPEFKSGWTSSSYSANNNNGYDFVLRPDLVKSWHHLESVTVRVVADD